MVAKPIAVIVLSGTREKLQMAAMTAVANANRGNKVSVFLSMNALEHFVRETRTDAPFEGTFGKLLMERNAPGFKQLFERAVHFGGARIHPCAMALDVLGLRRDALEPFVLEPIDFARFLDGAEGAQVWTF